MGENKGEVRERELKEVCDFHCQRSLPGRHDLRVWKRRTTGRGRIPSFKEGTGNTK